jgi:peptide/nickel transport system substrate-binding protein
VVRNDTTRLFRLQKGELNLVQNAIPPYAVKFIERNKNLRVLRAPGINYSYMGFNLHDPNKITSNLKVRQAIAHSINRKQIIEKLLKGQARLATGLLSPEHWGYNPDGPTYDLDLPKARALLDEAGFRDPDGDGPQMRFEISYKTSTNKLRNRIAEVVAAQLIEVGIGMEKRSYEWGTFYADVKKGNFQTYTLSWVGITDPDIFHYIFHSKSVPPQGANRGRFIRPKVDKLIDKTRYETNHEKRKKLFIEIQKEISEQCVYVSLWWADNIVVTDIALTGYSIRPGGEYTALATANWEPSQ